MAEPGTIFELDPNDALGWIQLESGGRVRFGGTSLRDFKKPPDVGARVLVHETGPGYGGAIRALKVTPFRSGPEPEPEGMPEWDQADANPSCKHGEMHHLADYNGGQFLDGALHIFVCREQKCAQLEWVVEF